MVEYLKKCQVALGWMVKSTEGGEKSGKKNGEK